MGTVSRRRIAVFGAGAWGTALAQAFSASHEVVLWGRDRGQL
ncbi:MAG TPA: glycerol-3-phosphate dehydrogenase, partial [Thauera aminoaromatica]|nr:glycerol-3-phosphate dehydrogenase [Thauera aminoaromatica]